MCKQAHGAAETMKSQPVSRVYVTTHVPMKSSDSQTIERNRDFSIVRLVGSMPVFCLVSERIRWACRVCMTALPTRSLPPQDEATFIPHIGQSVICHTLATQQAKCYSPKYYRSVSWNENILGLHGGHASPSFHRIDLGRPFVLEDSLSSATNRIVVVGERKMPFAATFST